VGQRALDTARVSPTHGAELANKVPNHEVVAYVSPVVAKRSELPWDRRH